MKIVGNISTRIFEIDSIITAIRNTPSYVDGANKQIKELSNELKVKTEELLKDIKALKKIIKYLKGK
ncbi:hypothetical protein MBCUT_07640 [Methanobrevibacter cuticularis]|uniref:Uncharacterized protein n=1 Tax=Methanobrevibacter cuticularis TaxID=47311 RepID=A0A166EDB1_9EURY|nr:hypothetical protein [Methanobrevibacter cuticularis]KZX16530.1 hypothetical protein MBCUT_07640 [Methanobrevibacter cuticularis]